MLSQQQQGDKAAILNGRHNQPPSPPAGRGRKHKSGYAASEQAPPLTSSPPLSKSNFGNKLLNYRRDQSESDALPLIERHLRESEPGALLNEASGEQPSRVNGLDNGQPAALVRANSLNTNSTGDQSKYDDEYDEDEDGQDELRDELREDGHEREGDCQRDDEEADEEKQSFLGKENENEIELGLSERASFIAKKSEPSFAAKSNKIANLARQESIFEQEQTGAPSSTGESTTTESAKEKVKSKSKEKEKQRQKQKERRKRSQPADEQLNPKEQLNTSDSGSCCCCWCCPRMLQFLCPRKCLTVTLLILVIYSIAIYSLPFVQVDPKIPSALPTIPFDFERGPLRASSASAFKVAHLFKDQLHGPESLAFDSQGNCYMAIEGGFVLYAHLNKSSPIKRAYTMDAPSIQPGGPLGRSAQQQNQQNQQQQQPELVKIADLNGMRPIENSRLRPRRDNSEPPSSATHNYNQNNYNSLPPVPPGWQRECQLDEKIYGPRLYEQQVVPGQPDRRARSFKSNVRVSRCSKPLGVRLSRDESSLYVIDTLSGLYRVDLRQADPLSMSQRQVTKLIDFKVNNGHQELATVQLTAESSPSDQQLREAPYMNVSLRALDDLVLDQDESGHDLIYMTVASQQWPATSYLYDALEGRPSGLVLRYNTSDHETVVLEPNRLAHVRTSAVVLDEEARARVNASLLTGRAGHQPSILMGAPRLDENDVFDDRPLNFPNGLELTGDGQALLISDTSNKRIIRHYLRGPRRGTSDLWAWTPMFPDNIRRGYDKSRETYWVVGCGRAPAGIETKLPVSIQSADIFTLLRTWPRVRKFLLKNIYFFGYVVEFMGANLFKSNKVQDVGYELRTGSSLLSSGCSGMMIIQYNRYGDIIRSIHSREFPNDLYYYSQVNELVDPSSNEHALYLGSPSYNYLTRLVLPTESHVLGPPNANDANSQASSSLPLLNTNNENVINDVNQNNNRVYNDNNASNNMVEDR